MNVLMKGLKIVGLGVVIWGLSLLWPDVNLVLTPLAMIGIVLGLGVATLLARVLVQHLDQSHDDEAGQDHPSPDISGSDSIVVLNTA
jgi:hypothetical protein